MFYLKKKDIFLKTKILIVILLFTACDHFFEFSVYEANVKPENINTTAKNLQLLKDVEVDSPNFKFAFVTDNHYFYKNLRTVIDAINKREDVLFVVFGGDIADQALLK